jgi:hypothetical protein
VCANHAKALITRSRNASGKRESPPSITRTAWYSTCAMNPSRVPATSTRGTGQSRRNPAGR